VTWFAWIEAEKAKNPKMSITRACAALQVSRSGYYAWHKRRREPLRGRAAQDAALVEAIADLHSTNPNFTTYGSPRLHRELLALGHTAGRHKVARVMRVNGIVARRRGRGKKRSVPLRKRPDIRDLVKREFNPKAPNRVWCTDVTMIRTGQGWIWAAVMIDLFSRRVVSWAAAERDTPETAMQALQSAIQIRRPEPGCIIHSDRGYQFVAHEWVNTITAAGHQVSMGQRRSPLDNAVIESWFASMKTESLYPAGQPATRAEARELLFRYIVWHNETRRHSTLDYRSPAEFERIATVS
jgi:putative transposase